MTDPLVELVYFDGCPNVKVARHNLMAALKEIGAAPDWVEWDLLADGFPQDYRGYASPTVLVKGRDVLGGERLGQGVACRVEGAPSATQIVNALLANHC